MSLFTKYELTTLASHGIITVSFTKVNGENRNMRCTLMPEHIVDNRVLLQEGEVPKAPRPDNPDVLAVWDVDAQGWRSFRIDSVHRVD